MLAYNNAGNGKYSNPITVTTAEGGESVQCLSGRGGMVLNERDRDSSKAISYPESSCLFWSAGEHPKGANSK